MSVPGKPSLDGFEQNTSGTPNPAVFIAAGESQSNTAVVPVDADGRIVVKNNTSASRDVFLDVIGWDEPATKTWSYTYNGDGLRTKKTAPDGTVTSYAWDKSGGLPMLIAETTGANTTRYLYGPDGLPIQDVQPDGSARYYHHDQIGSTRALTNQSGAVIGSTTYNAYGKVTSSTGTATTPLGYAGQYTDTETGLQYLRARYYEPATGTFLTRDPAVAITREAYGYANNNPLNATDPTGLGCGITSPGDCIDALVEAADDTVEFAWRNRGTIATIGAAGACLVPGWGLAACGYAAATAFGVRAEQRVAEDGFSNSLRANLVDGVLTYLTFGLAGAFETLAGPWAGVAGVGALERSGGLSYLGRLFPAGYDITNLFGWLDEQC